MIENSIWKELKARIEEMGLRNEFTFNQTLHSIKHTHTGNEIICIGIDDPEKIKSISSPTGAWIEEATELSREDFNQLDTRIRGTLPNYKQIMLTFNPTNVNSWVKGFFFDGEWPKVFGNTVINRTIVETTFKDNAWLTDEDIAALQLKAELDPNFYRVYFLGEWGIPSVENPFMFNWDESLIDDTIEFKPNQPLYVSFDFNVDPMTASVHQFGHDYYYTLDEFRISNSNTEELCDLIQAKYGHMQIIATGDASGNARRSGSRLTDWQIIKNKLNPVIRVPRKNPSLEDSRGVSNVLLKHYPNRKIHPRCEYLIEDCRLVSMKDGKIDKTGDSRLTHLLDTLRYNDWTHHRTFINTRLPKILSVV
jgi:hypothetical protein